MVQALRLKYPQTFRVIDAFIKFKLVIKNNPKRNKIEIDTL